MTRKLKRPIAFLLSLTMIMTMFMNVTSVMTASAETTITPTAPTGAGTEDSPYQIGTAGELYWFAQTVNGGKTAISAVLTADITVNSDLLGSLKYDTIGDVTNGNSFTAWTPIGYYSYTSSDSRPYTGTFDGQGHTISGLYFKKTTTNYVGLFGYVKDGGHILNVGVVDSYFSGSQDVGGVCGYNYHGTITNCYNTGSVSGNSKVGGVCGENSYNDTIENCYNTGSVSGSNLVGGVCGYNDLGTITNCYSLKTDTINKDINAIGNENSETAGKAESQNTTLFTDGRICDLVGYHSHQNGICILCGNYKPATKTTDKYDINRDDTKDEVYEISSAGQLYWFAALVNDETTNANAVLTADITVNKDVLKSDGTLADDVSGFKSWTPIGYYNSSSNFRSYTGTFDGQRHTISGLYFNDTQTSYVGLFGYVGNGGRVLNVGVVDSYFSGSNLVGGVCGYNKGKITNCYNEGTVSGSSNSSGSNNSNYVGGVCGDNDNGTIENCYNKGTVSGSTTAGGVCGYNKGSGKITNCYNKGKVSGGAASKVGGVCGWNYGTIENCYSTGAVSGGNENVGGVCGRNDGTITSCYNTGSVSGGENVGGVCGYNKGSGKIKNCYNKGTVNGSSNYVGGVCGYNEGTIENCYNTGSASNSSNYYVGGVCGKNDNGTITGCYYDSDKCNVGGIKDADAAGQAEGKTSKQFASGEVAYLLNGKTSEGELAWGQTLDGAEKQEYPVLSGAQVYQNTTYNNCEYDFTHNYANTQTESNSPIDHADSDADGYCDYCENIMSANLTLTVPQDGEAMPSAFTSLSDGISVSDFAVYSEDTTADYNKTYTVTANVSAEGKVFLNTPTFSINGTAVTASKNEDGSYAVSFEFKPTVDLSVSAKMVAGASIRLIPDNNGIRFYTEFDAAKIAELQAKDAKVELGTLIAPQDKLTGKELTFEDLDESEYIDVKYEATNADGSFIWHDNANNDHNGRIAGSIVKIKETGTTFDSVNGNIARNFVGRGYVKVTFDGKTVITYADYAKGDINNNARSLAYVANSLKNDAAKYDALDNDTKSLVDNWASKLRNE